MEPLLLILGLGIVVIIIAFTTISRQTGEYDPSQGSSKSGTRAASRGSSRPTVKDRETEWVQQVNQLLEREQPDDEPWRTEPASDRQIKYITELFDEKGLNFSIKSGVLSKGRASDVIGLFHQPEEDDFEKLKFFKVDGYRKMNQTQARDVIRDIFKDEGNIAAWNARPPSKEQKDSIRFMGGKVAKGMTHDEASELLGELADQDEKKFDELQERFSIFEEVNEPDNRETYDCKKVSWTQFNAVVDEMMSKVDNIEDIDPYDVIEKAIEAYPALQK